MMMGASLAALLIDLEKVGALVQEVESPVPLFLHMRHEYVSNAPFGQHLESGLVEQALPFRLRSEDAIPVVKLSFEMGLRSEARHV